MSTLLHGLGVLLVLAISAGCSSSSAPDSGHDAGEDAGVDTAVDTAVDAGADAGARRDLGVDAGTGVVEGWELVPYLPAACGVRRPVDPVTELGGDLAYAPCEPQVAGCDHVVPSWPRETTGSGLDLGYFATSQGLQTGADAQALVFATGYEVRLYTISGTPITGWRSMRAADPGAGDCMLDAVGIANDGIVLGFDVHPGRELPVDYTVALLTSTLSEVATTRAATENLGDATVFGNLRPWEIDYDGTNTAVLLYPGYVYIARFGEHPWFPIAVETTGDFSPEAGWFFGGDLYWDSYPTTTTGLRRVRRSGGGATEEVLPAGPMTIVGGFRTDGDWAVWVEQRFADAADTTPDSSAIVATPTHGVSTSGAWTPRDVDAPPAANLINQHRPLLSHGRFAFTRSEYELELIDLPGNRRVILRPPSAPGHDFNWVDDVLYVDGRYLFAVVQDGLAGVELRRYTIDQLDGWTSIP